MLIDQISGKIEAEGLEAGQLIGTHGELCERYQVSQSVFFQATRIMIDRGVVELRKGNGGGLFVADRSLAQCGQRMAKYFECIGITFPDCTEVNRMLQELCMRLATGNLTVAAVDRIRAIEQSLASADYYRRNYLLSRLSQEFAEGTGNIVLALLYRCITDVMLDFGVNEEDSSPLIPQVVLVDLSVAMSEAVIAGRHEDAAALYAQFRDALIRKNKLEEAHRSVGARKRVMGHEAARHALPDRVAALILHDITANGLPDGHRLGREEELLARYGVSRATFRQAIALLREYSIVEMRRGPTGGLIVRTPDFALIQETALDMMIRRGASQRDALAVWEALMMLALDRAAAQSAPALIDACRDAAALHGSAQASVGLLTRRLVDLAGLPILGIFAGLVAELGARLPKAGMARGERPDQMFAELERSLLAGDYNRARAALRDVLGATGIVLASAESRAEAA